MEWNPSYFHRQKKLSSHQISMELVQCWNNNSPFVIFHGTSYISNTKLIQMNPLYPELHGYHRNMRMETKDKCGEMKRSSIEENKEKILMEEVNLRRIFYLVFGWMIKSRLSLTILWWRQQALCPALCLACFPFCHILFLYPLEFTLTRHLACNPCLFSTDYVKNGIKRMSNWINVNIYPFYFSISVLHLSSCLLMFCHSFCALQVVCGKFYFSIQ